MAKIVYAPAAIEDLEQIGDYISQTLKSPMSALNTVSKIQDTVDTLAEFPLIGAPLSRVVGIGTDYRFLVCGGYIAFYRVHGDTVCIDRVLYGKRDYVAILFPSLPGDKE